MHTQAKKGITTKAEDEKKDEQSKKANEQQELTDEDLEAVQGGAKKEPESIFMKNELGSPRDSASG